MYYKLNSLPAITVLNNRILMLFNSNKNYLYNHYSVIKVVIEITRHI